MFIIQMYPNVSSNVKLDNFKQNQVNGSLNLYDETSLSVEFAPTFAETDIAELSANATENVDISCQVLSAFPPLQLFSW